MRPRRSRHGASCRIRYRGDRVVLGHVRARLDGYVLPNSNRACRQVLSINIPSGPSAETPGTSAESPGTYQAHFRQSPQPVTGSISQFLVGHGSATMSLRLSHESLSTGARRTQPQKTAGSYLVSDRLSPYINLTGGIQSIFFVRSPISRPSWLNLPSWP